MDLSTNTRQVVQLNERHISELERALSGAEKQYQKELADSKVLAGANQETYAKELKEVFDHAYNDLSKLGFNSDAGQRVGRLSQDVNSLLSKHQNDAFGAQVVAEAAESYVKAQDAAFEIAFCQIASLFEKRSKDYSSHNGKNGADAAQVEHARKFLQKKAKEYRKALNSREPDEVQQFLIEKFDSYKALVQQAEKQQQEFDAIDRNPFVFPVRAHRRSDGFVDVTLPILADKLEQKNGLVKLITDRVSQHKPNVRLDGPLYAYRTGVTDQHLLDKVAEPLKSIDDLAKAKVKFYVIVTNDPVELKSLPPVQKEEAQEPVHASEFKYSLNQVAEKLGAKYGTVLSILHGRHQELLEKYSTLVPEKKRKNKFLRLFNDEIFGALESLLTGKKARQKPIETPDYKAPHATESVQPVQVGVRAEFLKLGDDYLMKHLERPNASRWESDYGKDSVVQIVEKWKDFESFADDLCGLKGKKGVVKKPTPRYQSALVLNDASRGMRDIDVAKKHGICTATVSKLRERAGLWNARYLRSNYPTIDDIEKKPMPGVISYPKDKIREEIILKSIDHLKTEQINYLGLEGAHFGSYLWLNDFYKINPKKSLVAECSTLDYRIMNAIIENHRVFKPGKVHQFDGKVFKGLNLYNGNLRDAVAEASKTRPKPEWNLLYLDYNGCVTDEKISTWELLFKKKLIADDAVLFVTLNNSALMKERLVTGNGLNGKRHTSGYGTNDQVAISGASLKGFADKNGYSISPIDSVTQYKSKVSPMLFLGYKINRR